jgi:predicted Fe-Mo cluster-binding NifX family protein
MKIAVPEHQGRVAPVFDACRRILVFAEQDDGHILVAQDDWSTVSRQARAARLKELGVDVLLCGGISCGIEDQIHGQGIGLVAWLAGEVPKILKAYREGRSMDPEYAMPGTLVCRQRRQRRRGIRAQIQRNQDATPKSKEKKSCQGWTEEDHLEPVPEPEGA